MTKLWKGRKSRRVRMAARRMSRMEARARSKRNSRAELIRAQMAAGGSDSCCGGSSPQTAMIGQSLGMLFGVRI